MAPMGNLPDEIIREIITALPAKTVARFRSVRKSWRALISDPDLIRAHLTHFSSAPHHHSLLFKRIYKSDQADNYLIRRPSALSDSVCEQQYLSFVQMPSQSHPALSCNLGFGFNPVSPNLDDYKVIKIVNVGRHRCKKVEVYSLRSNSWRVIKKTLPWNINVKHFEHSLMFNGCVHWRATRREADNVTVWHILCFDMVKEAFGEIELPEVHAPPKFPPMSCNVGVLEGCLCILDHWDNLWVMREYRVAESWSRRYAISREAIGLYLRPLGFTCSGEVILEKRSDGWLYCYDTKNGNLEDIELPRLHKGDDRRPIDISFITYVESLVWVL